MAALWGLPNNVRKVFAQQTASLLTTNSNLNVLSLGYFSNENDDKEEGAMMLSALTRS